MSHISEFAVLMENNLTQSKGVDIHLLLLCCGKFCVAVREFFVKNFRSAGVKGWEPLGYMT